LPCLFQTASRGEKRGQKNIMRCDGHPPEKVFASSGTLDCT